MWFKKKKAANTTSAEVDYSFGTQYLPHAIIWRMEMRESLKRQRDLIKEFARPLTDEDRTDAIDNQIQFLTGELRMRMNEFQDLMASSHHVHEDD